MPDWAHQTGYIVSQNGQEGPIVTDLVNGNPVLPSARGLTYFAKNSNNVRDWIVTKRSMWWRPWGRVWVPTF